MNFGTQWRSHQGSGVVTVAVTFGLVVLYLAVSVVATQIFIHTGFVQFDPAVGLVVPFSVVFGVVGVAAAALGLVARDVIHGAVGVGTVIVALAHVFGGYLAYRVGWRTRVLSVGGALSAGQGPRERGRWFVEFGLLALVGSTVIAATVAWGNELLAIAPFYLAFFTAVQYFLATVVLGVPFLALVAAAVPERHSSRSTTDESGLTYFVPLVTVVSLGWFAVGVVGSLGFRIVAAFPESSFYGAGLGFLVTLSDPGLFGRGAVRLLTVLAAVSIALLALLLVADRREVTDRRDTEVAQ